MKKNDLHTVFEFLSADTAMLFEAVLAAFFVKVWTEYLTSIPTANEPNSNDQQREDCLFSDTVFTETDETSFGCAFLYGLTMSAKFESTKSQTLR